MLAEPVAKVRLLFAHCTLRDTAEAVQELPGCRSNQALGEGTASANQPQQQHAHSPRHAGQRMLPRTQWLLLANGKYPQAIKLCLCEMLHSCLQLDKTVVFPTSSIQNHNNSMPPVYETAFKTMACILRVFFICISFSVSWKELPFT